MRSLTEQEVASYDVVGVQLARRVRVQRVPVLAKGFDAMTLGPLILMRRDDDHSGGRALLAHELVHVGQYAHFGMARFLWRYAREYLSSLRRLGSMRQAYEAVSFEVQARAVTEEWIRRRSTPR